MLQIVKNNNPLIVIILFIYALVINWQVLFHPELPVVREGDFLFHIITGFLSVVLFKSAFGFTMLAIVMQAIQGIYLNAVANRHKLFSKPSYVTAFTHISLVSLHPSFGFFSQPLLINWVIIMVIDSLLQLGQSQKPRKLIYNTGFGIGIAALLSFPAVAFILLLLLALSLLRNLHPGEWIVAILGCLTPIYFAAGLLYLFDALHWFPEWVNLGLNLPRTIDHPALTIGSIIGIIILFVMGVYTLQKQMARVNVFVRRGWTALTMCLFFCVVAAVITDFKIQMAWLVVMPPMALIIANAYYAEKNKAFSNFAFYFMLLLVVFCKMAAG